MDGGLVFAAICLIIVIFVVVIDRPDELPLPEPEPEPKSVKGIVVGKRTYADLEFKRCIDVLGVQGNKVRYIYSNDPLDPHETTIEQFVEQFYYTPNGCDVNNLPAPL